MFDTMKVANKIRNARIAQNLTQMNLADAMGVSYQAVSVFILRNPAQNRGGDDEARELKRAAEPSALLLSSL